MKSSVVEIPSMQLIGASVQFRGTFSPESNAAQLIPELWEKVSAATSQLDVAWGVAIGAMSTITNSSDMLYFAGVQCHEVPQSLPTELEVFSFHGGKYLVIEHVGDLAGLEASTHKAYEEIFPASGFSMRNHHHLEIYDERFNPHSPDSIVGIAIPIE